MRLSLSLSGFDSLALYAVLTPPSLAAPAVKLNSSRIAIEQAAFEPSLRGDWPKDNYTRLLTLQLALLQALAQLAQALIRLDHTWRERLVHETAFLNQPLVRLSLSLSLSLSVSSSRSSLRRRC